MLIQYSVKRNQTKGDSMKTYSVLFVDGSTILVSAVNESGAATTATALYPIKELVRQGYLRPVIKRIEIISESNHREE